MSRRRAVDIPVGFRLSSRTLTGRNAYRRRVVEVFHPKEIAWRGILWIQGVTAEGTSLASSRSNRKFRYIGAFRIWVAHGKLAERITFVTYFRPRCEKERERERETSDDVERASGVPLKFKKHACCVGTQPTAFGWRGALAIFYTVIDGRSNHVSGITALRHLCVTKCVSTRTNATFANPEIRIFPRTFLFQPTVELS